MSLALPLSDPAGGSRVADFIRRNRAVILERWHDALKDRPAMRNLDRERLVNHMPELLEAIAATDEARADDPRIRLATSSAEQHAVERLGDGFDLDQVVIELAVLRDCILDAWDAEGVPMARPDSRFLNRSMDRAMAAAVKRFGAARDRTLLALDRVSSASLASRSLDDLLQRLLDVVVQTMPSVDAGAFLLREGDALVVRATAGAYGSLRGGRLAGGAGLAGRVAASGQAAQATHAADGLLPSETADDRVVYAVPLVETRVVIGVVEVRSAGGMFSAADERLVETLAARASATILQHMLSETSDRRAAELDAVLKSVPDAIVVAASGRVTLENPAARELFGLDALRRPEPWGWLAQMEPRALATGEALALEAWPMVIAAGTGRPHVDDLVLRHGSSGRDVAVRVLAAPVRGQPDAVVVVCTDITERRRIEAEREALVAALQDTLQDREHVLAVVAHDLRSPLSTIGLAAHALANAGPDTAIGRRAVESVERATQRMNRLIQDLLDASSIRAGRLALDLQPLAPGDVLADVAEAFAPRAAEKGLEFAIHSAPGLPSIRADHERLVQALSNIVGNAIKVCATGAVKIGVALAGREIVFTVSDTGPGIEEGLRETMFEPFRRGAAPYRGTGLGLAIARGIVEGHGGRIQVEDTPGGGATFRVALPLP